MSTAADQGIPTARTSSFRPDIEGLRAFAVLLVVLNHLHLWPAGGYVGVDVFFTISGFLITGLIADEISRTGRFSIGHFYSRRARRILPAAFAVLLATWIAAKIVFVGSRVQDTVVDIWWSMGFAANIHFASAGTDYFQTYQQPSLVQHYWSLAVEEQFYVVWPLLLLGVTLWARKSAGSGSGAVVFRVAALAALASFAWCIYQTLTDPSAAYFSTIGRGWELGVGALVALAARQGFRVPPRLAGPLCLVGLTGIVASAAVADSTTIFPGPGAAIPVLFSALVLFSGCGGVSESAAAWQLPLTNPISRYVGRVSFSLYLWHWPVILVVGALVTTEAGIYYPLVISAIAALTVFSYYAIEMPFHASGRKKHQESSRGGRPRSVGGLLGDPRFRRPALAVTILLACTTVIWAFRPATPEPVELAAAPTSSTAPALGPQTQDLQAKITEALQATQWPDLSPNLADVVSGKTPPNGMDNCVGPDLPPAEICTYGSPTAQKVAFVVGDSTAQAYMETIKHVVADNAPDWRVRFIGMAGCTFVDVRIDNPVTWVADACPSRKQAAIDLIRQQRPDLVIVTNNYGGQIDASTGKDLSTADWAAGLNRYTEQFRSSTKDVVFMSPPTVEADIMTCYTALSVPANCISRVTPIWSDYAVAVQRVASTQQAHFLDSTSWFCAGGLCPAFVGTVPTKKDIVHVTDAYADVISPAVYEAFTAEGLLQ